MPDLTRLPWGSVMTALARCVVESQLEIDHASHRAATAMLHADDETNAGDARGRPELTLKAMGLVPTFYHVADTQFDIAITVGLGRADAARPGAPPEQTVATVTPVEAGTATIFGLAARHAGRLRFRIVPVPQADDHIVKKMLADAAKTTDSSHADRG